MIHRSRLLISLLLAGVLVPSWSEASSAATPPATSGAGTSASTASEPPSTGGTLYAFAAPSTSSQTNAQPAATATCNFSWGAPGIGSFETYLSCVAGSTWSNQSQLRLTINNNFLANGTYVTNPTSYSRGTYSNAKTKTSYYVVQYASATAPPGDTWVSGPTGCFGFGTPDLVCIINWPPFIWT